MHEEVFSLSLSNYFRFGSFFSIRNHFKCDKRYFWHLRNINPGVSLSYFGFCIKVFVLVIYCDTEWRSKVLFVITSPAVTQTYNFV